MSADTTSASTLLRYGEYQGSFKGVFACSNRDDGFFSGENNYIQSLIYTGFRYQCVEYARRFVLLTTGCIFASCGRASEIYKMTVLTHVETGVEYPLVAHNNGHTTQRPEVGDILIYPYDKCLTPWGHVSIVSYVEEGRIGVSEQNQFFGRFTSPSPDYEDGELCVARYIDLAQDDKGCWRLNDVPTMSNPLGWMSYVEAPRRSKIHAPFNPLPTQVSVRSTDYTDARHPRVLRCALPEGMTIPCGLSPNAFAMRGGAGECLVGAGTAVCRILRLMMAMLFDRSRVGDGMRSLPTNPLGTPRHHLSHASPTEQAVYDALKQLSGEAVEAESEPAHAALLSAIAAHFDLDVEVVEAMEREVRCCGPLYLCAGATYRLHMDEEGVHAAEASDGLEMRTANPHDECWSVARINMGTPRHMAELVQLAEVAPQVIEHVEEAEGANGLMQCSYRMDMAGYLKAVEELRGPRTALTIVLAPEMDGLQRELVSALQACCERVKYPVRVLAEADLVMVDGKLMATPTEASPEASSPLPSTTPINDYLVNFVFTVAEWSELFGHPAAHRALLAAALSPSADVVFAKPLWSLLLSGGLIARPMATSTTRRSSKTKLEHHTTTKSMAFFDLTRHLYALALPSQSADSWDQEVSEFKDSCRRVGVARELPRVPPFGITATAAIINGAISATMGHAGAKFSLDAKNTGEDDGLVAPMVFLFTRG